MSREGTLYRRCPKCTWSSRETSLKKCGRPGCGNRKLHWTWQLDIAPPGSPRKRISRTFASRDDALGALDEHKTQLRKGRFSQGRGSMNLAEWMGQWLEREERRVKAGTLKVRTHEGYTAHLRLYIEGSSVGGIRIDRLTREVHATIRRSLADAVQRSVLMRNPATGAHQAPAYVSLDAEPWNPNEVKAFLISQELKTDGHRAAFHLGAMTGLRRGEILGLRWSDVNFETRKLTVTRAVVRSKTQGLILGEPKTKAARRTIRIDKRTLKLLKRHRKQCEIDRRWMNRSAAVASEDIIFSNEQGGPLCPDAFSAHFGRLVKRTGLRKVGLHDLRRSHASHLIAIGKSALFVQRRLGHAKVTTTLEVYGHLFSSMEQSDVDEAAELIYSGRGTK